jgi:glycosyltransferase involved in cell wall biosynthesis
VKDFIAGKCQAARYYLGQLLEYLHRWKDHYLTRRRCSSYFRAAVRRYRILVGPVLQLNGGVVNHMRAIPEYSSLPVGLFPSEDLLRYLLRTERCGEFRHAVDVSDFSRVQVIHTHANIWLVQLLASTEQRDFGWVHTYHTLYFPEDWEGGLDPWKKSMNQVLLQEAPRADIRICISHWLQDHLLGEHGLKTVYVPNGVRVDRCEAADGERFVARHGVEDFVLFVGTLHDIKNPGAFVRLAAEMPSRQFVIIGHRMSEQNIRTELGMDVPPNLAVHAHMPHGRVLDAMAACRAFVMTSRSEGLPTVLMEAMAMEKPVVAPNSYGCAEVVGSERCGYLYEPGSFSDLVEKTRSALEDRTRGSQARERVLEEYDWRVVAPRLDRVYERLMNR